MVLFAVATASVRGFALMLLIGTALSMLTAVLATRAILALLGGFGWIDNPRLMGATGQGIPRWRKYDYIGRRNIWFAFSGVVVAISIGAILFKGLNLGIDFEGGTQINFRTPQPTSLETVREQAAGNRPSRRRHPGPRLGEWRDQYQNFQIRTDSLTIEEQNALQETSRSQWVRLRSARRTSPRASEGRSLNSAILAIIVSLLLIGVYVTARFQWKYSVGVLVALAHDVLITLAYTRSPGGRCRRRRWRRS